MFDPKVCYALNVQVICDHKSRVNYVYSWWPGSTHNIWAWRNSKVFLNTTTYFFDGEYLPGDSAYSASKYIVQNFTIISMRTSTITWTREHCCWNTSCPFLFRDMSIQSTKPISMLLVLIACLVEVIST